ncbi:hypothetical protein AHMF7605_06870 [Adhaeribacter arboris]|uniref:Entericidin n=1 Tax=Adhaeribacter arboris TaxID=2072846 RepID=A0A2T2YCL9_9BACT|nr:hypothetical protein [Adhaeribacter arboris]PSR53271.1 hypothetical protein AHMF7605_06870 [Adhaeribacter arboris]
MKNLSKFAFVALTALTFAFTSCGNSGTKQEGASTETTEGSDATTTDSASTDAMGVDSAATTTTPDTAAAQ